MQYCPNCNSKIQDKLFSVNKLISPDQVKLINAFTSKNAKAYCDNCADQLLRSAKLNIREMKKEIKRVFKEFIFSFPVLSLENPLHWDYTVIGLMSESVVVGANAVEKVSGEKVCLQKLKVKLFNMGGNAILGARIQFDAGERSQLSTSNILSIYGTAVKVKNAEQVFPKEHHEAAAKYYAFDDSRRLLKSFDLL